MCQSSPFSRATWGQAPSEGRQLGERVECAHQHTDLARSLFRQLHQWPALGHAGNGLGRATEGTFEVESQQPSAGETDRKACGEDRDDLVDALNGLLLTDGGLGIGVARRYQGPVERIGRDPSGEVLPDCCDELARRIGVQPDGGVVCCQGSHQAGLSFQLARVLGQQDLSLQQVGEAEAKRVGRGVRAKGRASCDARRP